MADAATFETIHVDDRTVPCDGGTTALGHPRVFLHIEKYKTASEADLANLLGSPRRVRTFARRFDELVGRVPFRVRIETTGVMKTYVKENH